MQEIENEDIVLNNKRRRDTTSEDTSPSINEEDIPNSDEITEEMKICDLIFKCICSNRIKRQS